MVVALFCAMCFATADPVESGLKPGQKPGPYSFLVCTGPERGQPTCYVCDAADKPIVIVFARDLSEPLGKLAIKLDQAAIAQKSKDLRTWLTLTGKHSDAESKLAAWSKKLGLRSMPVGVFEDADGPPAYQLHRDAAVTVILAVKRQAVRSYAFRPGELNDKAIGEIAAAIGKLAGN